MSLHPPREASRATSEGIIISKYPDVCRSPTAPVPYTIVAYQNNDANTASSVFMTGQRAHKQNSIVTKCMGDEPGVGLGVKSGTVSSICHRKEHSKTVRVEGQWATRDTDEWWMNNRNTIGKLVWPKHNLSFSPTPPIAAGGGVGSTTPTAPPLQLAFANTGITSDAPPIGASSGIGSGANSLKEGTRLAFLDTSKTGTGTTSSPPSGTTQQPQRTPPPAPKFRWWRFAKWGRRLNPYMSALELFFHQNPGYFADMPTITEEERDIVREAQRAIDRGSDPQEVRRWARQQIEAERQRVEQEEEEHTPPVPNTRTSDNTSVKRRCRFVMICFDRKQYDKTEYDRQLSLQQNGINAMKPSKWLANRTKFEIPGQPQAQRRASLPYQNRARQAYEMKHGPGSADGLAALHRVDMVAGGDYFDIAGMGDTSINSSMGPSWNGRRVQRLKAHARQQLANNCPSVMVQLSSDPNCVEEPLDGNLG